MVLPCRTCCFALRKAFLCVSSLLSQQLREPHCTPYAGAWLGQMGVRSVVLDKGPGPPTHPQAHLINNRTMELLRSLALPTNAHSNAAGGTDSASPAARRGSANSTAVPDHCDARKWMAEGTVAAAVRAAAPPFEQWRHFRYVDGLVDGTEFGAVDHFPGALPVAPFILSECVHARPGHLRHCFCVPWQHKASRKWPLVSQQQQPLASVVRACHRKPGWASQDAQHSSAQLFRAALPTVD